MEVYWPDDSPEFAVRTDRRLVTRHLLVENLLGANIALPEKLLELASDLREETLSASEIKDLYEQEKKRKEESFIDALEDTFRPIRELVEGPEALVEEELYRRLKALKPEKKALSWVAAVKSEEEFVFLCLRGNRERKEAPRWLLVRGKEVETDLARIVSFLRQVLPGKEALPLEDAKELLEEAVKRVARERIRLLPPKKQRALELLSRLLPAWRRKAKDDPHRLELLKRLEKGLHPESGVELSGVAEAFLRLLPFRLKKWPRKKGRPTLLKDLYPELQREPLSTKDLEDLASSLRKASPLDYAVCACLVGAREKGPRPDPLAG